jgi:hypothetical protein
MKFETKLKKICNGDINIIEVGISQNTVEVQLPYDSSAFIIDYEGESDEERIESFKDNINKQLDTMIDHLNDCKL